MKNECMFQMFVGKIEKLRHGVDTYSRKIEKEKITHQKSQLHKKISLDFFHLASLERHKTSSP